ncbi:hypothetical protein RFI_12172 [Reticulomyxa filosa]|uniref:Transmembrane protein n=1 Tax=Reticulomyxa filosa TaxID=46433 RepID=X6NI00_RETFI|nr:hypothetical protein RFI_12172 [Reticulomyxa filosa]|eukprot:ETO24967.1 hypothetical protein RFI_12172 [Reticulomyxa filosa]
MAILALFSLIYGAFIFNIINYLVFFQQPRINFFQLFALYVVCLVLTTVYCKQAIILTFQKSFSKGNPRNNFTICCIFGCVRILTMRNHYDSPSKHSFHRLFVSTMNPGNAHMQSQHIHPQAVISSTSAPPFLPTSTIMSTNSNFYSTNIGSVTTGSNHLISPHSSTSAVGPTTHSITSNKNANQANNDSDNASVSSSIASTSKTKRKVKPKQKKQVILNLVEYLTGYMQRFLGMPTGWWDYVVGPPFFFAVVFDRRKKCVTCAFCKKKKKQNKRNSTGIYLYNRFRIFRKELYEMDVETQQKYYFTFSTILATLLFYLMFEILDAMIKRGLIIDLPLFLRQYSFTLAWSVAYLASVMWQHILNRFLVFHTGNSGAESSGTDDSFCESLWRTYLVYGFSLVLSGIVGLLLQSWTGLPERMVLFLTLPLSGVSNYYLLRMCYQRMEQTKIQATAKGFIKKDGMIPSSNFNTSNNTKVWLGGSNNRSRSRNLSANVVATKIGPNVAFDMRTHNDADSNIKKKIFAEGNMDNIVIV